MMDGEGNCWETSHEEDLQHWIGLLEGEDSKLYLVLARHVLGIPEERGLEEVLAGLRKQLRNTRTGRRVGI